MPRSAFFTTGVADADPAIARAIRHELQRQRDQIELIASENIVSQAVLEAQGSEFTNKYAEGYPGKRYYGGCEHVDVVEAAGHRTPVRSCLAAKYANVQPHSGAQANTAVMLALVQPGDTVLGMSLSAGGHLTHGAKPALSGKWFKAVQYGVRRADSLHRLRRSRTPWRYEHHAQDDHCWLLGVPRAPSTGRVSAPSPTSVGALPDGGHGPRGRSGRHRRVPQPGATCPCDHLHHPQNPARPPWRRDLDQRRSACRRRSIPPCFPVRKAAR